MAPMTRAVVGLLIIFIVACELPPLERWNYIGSSPSDPVTVKRLAFLSRNPLSPLAALHKTAKPSKVSRFLVRVRRHSPSSATDLHDLLGSLAPEISFCSLLIFAGDVEVNPGPHPTYKFPCIQCKKPVKSNQLGICCDLCNLWAHANCSHLSPTELSTLGSRNRGWVCQECIRTSLPFHDDLDDSANPTAPYPSDTNIPSQLLHNNSHDHHLLSPSLWYCNSRSLKNKLPELHHQLHSNPCAIHAFSETWLDDSISDVELLASANFTILRNDRGARGGGVLLAVPDFLPSVRRLDLETPGIELLWAEIRIASQIILVGILYRPPHSGMKEALLLEESLLKISSLSKQPNNIWLIGDFNMPLDWSSPLVSSSCSHHQKILDALSFASLSQVCPSPTYNTAKGEKHFLDLLFVKHSADLLDCIVGDGIGSDHAAITAYFNFDTRPSTPIEKKLIYLYRKGDYNHLKNSLNCINWDFLIDTPDVDDALDFWLGAFQAAISDSIPTKLVSVKPRKLPWTSPEIAKLSSLKRRLFRKFRATRDQTTLNLAKNTQRKLKQAIRSSHTNFIKNLSTLSKTCTKHFWANVTKLRRNSPNLTLSDGATGDLTCDREEISNLFLHQFTKQSQDSQPPPPWAPPDPPTQRASNGPTLDSISCSPNLVLEMLQKIDPNSSAGPDGVSPFILRFCAEEIATPLSLLFNKILSSGQIPSLWKKAWVIPLYKGNNLPRDCVTSYRPIALTSILCRTLERIINNQLLTFLESNNLLSPSQYGFRPGRSCEQALTKLSNAWNEALDDLPAPAIDVILFDFSSAFDRVNLPLLLQKLASIGIKGPLLSFLRSFLTGRTQQVLYKSALSGLATVSEGVPQGSVLGPVLFNIFLSDLPPVIDTLKVIFADDLTISNVIRSAADSLKLQSAINKILAWSVTNKLPLNIKKCQVLRITKTRNFPIPSLYLLDKVALPTVKTATILGVVFNSTLTAHDHINKTCAKANRILGFCTRLSAKGKGNAAFTTLYTALVLPILDYCATVWDPHQLHLIDRIEAIQRRASTQAWRLATGLSYSARPDYETRLRLINWQTLSSRRQSQKTLLFMKILSGHVPLDTELSTFISISARTGRPTPSLARTTQHSNSFFISTIRSWLSLPSPLTSVPLTSIADIHLALKRIKRFWRTNAHQ